MFYASTPSCDSSFKCFELQFLHFKLKWKLMAANVYNCICVCSEGCSSILSSLIYTSKLSVIQRLNNNLNVGATVHILGEDFLEDFNSFLKKCERNSTKKKVWKRSSGVLNFLTFAKSEWGWCFTPFKGICIGLNFVRKMLLSVNHKFKAWFTIFEIISKRKQIIDIVL